MIPHPGCLVPGPRDHNERVARARRVTRHLMSRGVDVWAIAEGDFDPSLIDEIRGADGQVEPEPVDYLP